MLVHSQIFFFFSKARFGYIVLLVTFVSTGQTLLTSHELKDWMNTSIPQFIVLYFSSPYRQCIFYKLKLFGNPASSKSFSTIFPLLFAHFTSLCYILIILALFQMFSSFFYLLWLSVIFDVTIIIVLGCHEPHTNKTESLMINTACDLTTPLTDPSHILLPLLRAPSSDCSTD